MAKTLQTNTFTGGMNTDISEELIKDNQYRYAENVRVITDSDSTTGVLQNIEDITKYASELPSNETVIGSTVVDKYGVIFTKSNSDTNLTKVYRVTGFDTQLTITCILKGYIGITDNILAVGNYETQNVIKVYFSDGNSILKVLNIVDNKYVAGSAHVDASGNIKVPSDIDIVPGANLVRSEIKGEASGNLTAGLVQYSCQLFNVHGSETNFSPLTGLFHLTSSSQANGSGQYKGTTKGENSNKGCSLRISNIPSNFQRCRIVRLLYTSNNESPKIEVIAELNVIGKSSIDYIDSGGIVLNELTPELFNTVSNNIFSPKAITKKDNRLFVANIQEDTWDVEYDARAYRCNSSKVVRLGNSTGGDLVYTLGSGDDASFYRSVPKEHDCICPFNSYDYSSYGTDKYMYSGNTVGRNNTMELGGKGLNVKYSFIITEQEGSFYSGKTGVDMNARSKTISSIDLRRPETGSSIKTISFPDGAITTIDNQASPIINYYTNSYHRDEIYRFGLVFYNNRGTASPVHWIGDIRFPRSDENDNGEAENSYYYKSFCVSGGDLEIRPIGIKFTINNIPSGVTGIEVVRCDRTENDKTILFQAALCNTYNNSYANSATGDLGGSTDIRPYGLFSALNPIYFSNGLIVDSGFLNTTATASWKYHDGNYKSLISPEISVMQDNIERSIQGKQLSLDKQYGLFSPTYGESKDGWTGRTLENVRGSILPNGTTGSVNAQGFTKVEDQKFYITMQPTGCVSYVAKYYTPFSAGRSNNKVKALKYPKQIPYNEVENKSGYYTSIGEKNYLNYSLFSFDGSNPYDNGYAKKHGIFGPCLISHVEDGLQLGITPQEKFQIFSKEATAKDFYYNLINAISIVNVRQDIQPYGGSLYTSRINSVYISTGSYRSTQEVTNDGGDVYVFGGDTILGILDQPVTMIYQKKDPNSDNEGKVFLAAYIPFETSINTWLLNGDMAHFDLALNGNYGAAYHQLLPTSMGSYFVQDKPYFVYNDAYSSQATSAKYTPKGTYVEDNMTFRNRILCSEAKTNNEITDSWTKFKYADYLDTDNAWGQITNLSTFKDKLFFWQDSALGVASVNERSLIDDGNVGGLVLGTGGILTRADYVTTTNGSSVVNDKSIVSSDNALYWYDKDKNEVCSYNGQVHQLSKEKGVQNYLNESKHSVKSSQYDSKYNEVWTSFDDKSLIFNEQLGAYTSFYTYTPEYTLQFSDSNITGIGNKLYKINKPQQSNNTALPKVCKVTTIVNKDAGQTKVFDNVSFPGEFEDSSNNNSIKKLDNLVKDIEFRTKTQTGAPMKPYYYSTADSNGLKYAYDCREDNYRFAIGRGKSKQNGQQTDDRMRGKWLESTYQFDCSSSDANIKKSFKLPYINTTYRHSLV